MNDGFEEFFRLKLRSHGPGDLTDDLEPRGAILGGLVQGRVDNRGAQMAGDGEEQFFMFPGESVRGQAGKGDMGDALAVQEYGNHQRTANPVFRQVRPRVVFGRVVYEKRFLRFVDVSIKPFAAVNRLFRGGNFDFEIRIDVPVPAAVGFEIDGGDGAAVAGNSLADFLNDGAKEFRGLQSRSDSLRNFIDDFEL